MLKNSIIAIFSFLTLAAHADPLESKLAEILVQNRASVDASQMTKLLGQFERLSQLNQSKMIGEYEKTIVQQFLSCRAADIVVIANGVGEVMPLYVGTAVREVNLRYIGPDLHTEIYEALVDSRWSWKSLFGSALDSVPGVIVETLATYDVEQIEKEIQKSFPGTNLLSIKLKGEKSFCGQATLKLDMLKSLLGK